MTELHPLGRHVEHDERSRAFALAPAELGPIREVGMLAETVVELANSWGTGWGLRGRFQMTAATWAALLDQQGDVTVPMR